MSTKHKAETRNCPHCGCHYGVAERDRLKAENTELLECLKQIEQYEHPGNADCFTKATSCILQMKRFATNRLSLYQSTTNEKEKS